MPVDVTNCPRSYFLGPRLLPDEEGSETKPCIVMKVDLPTPPGGQALYICRPHAAAVYRATRPCAESTFHNLLRQHELYHESTATVQVGAIALPINKCCFVLLLQIIVLHRWLPGRHAVLQCNVSTLLHETTPRVGCNLDPCYMPCHLCRPQQVRYECLPQKAI